MSRLSLAILIVAAALIVLAVLLELPFAQRGSGVLMLAGLAYAYVVAKREVELLAYAAKDSEDHGDPKPESASVLELTEEAPLGSQGFGLRKLPARALA